MKKSKSIVINRLLFAEVVNIEDIYSLFLNSPYLDSKGFGLKNVTVSNNIISAIAIKRSSTLIYDFNLITNEFERKPIFIFSEIQFCIDFTYNLMYVFGATALINTLKSLFRKIFEIKYEINSINLSAYTIYETLIHKRIRIEVKEFNIEKFVYKTGIIGRFSGLVSNNEIGLEIINEYKTDVNKLYLTVHNELDRSFGLLISNSGAIGIHCNDDDFNDNLENFKSFILK